MRSSLATVFARELGGASIIDYSFSAEVSPDEAKMEEERGSFFGLRLARAEGAPCSLLRRVFVEERVADSPVTKGVLSRLPDTPVKVVKGRRFDKDIAREIIRLDLPSHRDSPSESTVSSTGETQMIVRVDSKLVDGECQCKRTGKLWTVRWMDEVGVHTQWGASQMCDGCMHDVFFPKLLDDLALEATIRDCPHTE